MTEKEFHLKEAKNCNNKTWSILDKSQVGDEDRSVAIRLVNASYHHWLAIGEPINQQRGEYMLAKVYNKFGMNDLASQHSKKCLKLTEEYGFKDFDLAFAYEIMYRTERNAGNEGSSNSYFDKATEAGKLIVDKEDRDIFFSELERE